MAGRGSDREQGGTGRARQRGQDEAGSGDQRQWQWGQRSFADGPPYATGGLGYGAENIGYPAGYAGTQRFAPMPPSYAGRGPKGYRRSDARIEEDINERLTAHPAIDATDITVRVHDGEVTLEGQVDGRQAKRLAEDIADGVPGVHDVQNRLTIARGPSGGAGAGAAMERERQVPVEQEGAAAGRRGGAGAAAASGRAKSRRESAEEAEP